MANDSTRSLPERFERALGAITARVFDSGPFDSGTGLKSRRAMAVAFSGGLDSGVLLHLTHGYAAVHGITLHAFHVHHGLAADADAWLAHCRAQADVYDVAFDARHVSVDADEGSGIEAAARSVRYAALGDMCRAHDVPLLLTAHHLDDQAETVLLQLLRGSGVAGLSGMDACNHAPALLGDPVLQMGRPLLASARADLQAHAAAHDVAYIEDPSNSDPRHARNALRLQVMPVLAAVFPGFARRFARSAGHAQSAQQLIVELAAQDYAQCVCDDAGTALALGGMRRLSAVRGDNLLRYWFARRGMRMPSTAWLQELRGQLMQARADARILVGHADCDLHRHRDRVVMTARIRAPDPEQPCESFTWSGVARMDFPAFGGALHFEPAPVGVDATWLRNQVLALQWRSSGWRLKPAANTPRAASSTTTRRRTFPPGSARTCRW